MRKIFTLLALAMISVVSFAASITAADVDFGTVSIKGQSLPYYGNTTITVTWSGLTSEGTSMWAEISEGELDDETNPNGFYVGDPDYVYLGYGGNMMTSCQFTIGYGVKAAGTYTGKLHLYAYDTSWEQVDKYVNITITVTNEAEVPKTTPFERVDKVSDLAAGDVVIFVNEDAKTVNGAWNSTYLEAVTEGVKIADGKADVPETALMFTLAKSDTYWQFNSTKGLLGADGNSLKIGSGTTLWSIDITSGNATIVPKESSSWIQYNTGAPRFKLYSNAQADIQLYKKAGEAQEIESKLEIEDIVFGEVELDESKSVTVNYTAENLTEDIVWAIEGTDAALFDVEDSGNRTSGTVTVTYKGNGTKTGAVNASLSYLTQDVKLDAMEGSKAISLNLIPATVKLTSLAFSGAPTTIDQGQTIDMSKFVVYTPNDAADKSLTWTTDLDYQGTVDADGKLTAKHVTGNVIVTATSVRVPSVSASCTLKIVAPTITDFTLSKDEVTLNIGGTETLTITAFVPDYASATATWASGNTAVATVNKNGVITAKAIGDAEITATIGEVVKTCQVHVVAVTVESIAFDPAEANVTVGSTLQLNPVVTPAQAASEYTIAYVSDNEAVATVDENGKVTGVAAGDAVITATISDKSAEITIHVVAPQMFAKVTDASTLAEKDTIILATIYNENGVIAGARDNKKLTVITEGATVTATEAYADNALRLVIGTLKNKTGFTLQAVGSTKVLAENNNDLYEENTTSSKNLMWEFVADGSNGIYVRNLGNTNAMFKYHAGNAAIKPYKAATTGAVYVYVYVRKYVEPDPTGIGSVQNSEVSVQKVLRNGQVLIIRNGITYTLTGVTVR